MGIDLGGSRTEMLVLDDQLQPLQRKRCATPARDYDAILALIEARFERARSRYGADITLGIGIPGAISPHDKKSSELLGKPRLEQAAEINREVFGVPGRQRRFQVSKR